MPDDDIKKKVREAYGRIAEGDSCGCRQDTSCCGGGLTETAGREFGYSETEMAAVPDGANLGLGCGNPLALASLREGETVLDLGAGAGFDCFLAAQRVGKKGRVIGVDMTPEMVAKARANAVSGGYDNVEFRLGEIENLPLADGEVDAVISNCVINLVPDKKRAFAEAYRVLKTGGWMMVSDIVLLKPLPDAVRDNVQAYVGCIAGAELRDDYLEAVRDAGFGSIEVPSEKPYPLELIVSEPDAEMRLKQAGITPQTITETAASILSITVSARKL